MRVLVTGANGFLGTGIVKELLDRGQEVVVADLSCNRVDTRAQKFEMDFFDIDNPFEYFGKPDVLLHLAWRNGFQHNHESHIVDLPKHYLFLKKMIDSGISRISILGSMHEVGFHEGSITDSTPCNPLSLYGISKNALRESISLLTNDCDCIFQWIRGYYIVSNNVYGNSIFSKIAQSVQEGKTTFPFTSGINQYDFLDYNDFCEIVAAIVCQNKINGIINACSGRPEKLSDRVERFIKENNYNIQLIYGAYPDRPYDSKAIWGDSLKVEEILKNDKKS